MQRRPAQSLFWWVLASIGGVALLASAAVSLSDDPGTRPIEYPPDGYVSSRECRSCHPGQHGTWQASYHRRMTQVATPEALVGPFDGQELSYDGRSYRFEQRGRELWAGWDENGARVERRVGLTTGSHHFQAYWLETGDHRKLALLPFAYQIAESRWIPFDALMLQPPDYRQASPEGGEWNRTCIHCHTTRPEPHSLDESQMESVVAEFGIACEACHGPGREHVLANGNPLRRYALYLGGGADDTIVNPSRLETKRVSHVCAQCHSTRESFRGEKLREFFEFGYDYVPGDDLFATRAMIHGDGPQTLTNDVRTRFWLDGEVRVNGREYNSLQRSACYQRGDLTCLSCHVMHQTEDDPRPRSAWANDQLSPKMDGREACLQCHKQFRPPEKTAAHTHHAPSSLGSDCLNCHMPYTAWGLQKATRSHQVDSPTVQESVETGRPNACNQCHLDKPLAWTAARLEEWYGTPPPELERDDRELAAGVRWLVTGDAGQRALVAWFMGWEPARRASGTRWMIPYLGMALVDPYAAVRSVALRSLKRSAGFEQFEMDFMAPEDERWDAIDKAIRLFWESGAAANRAGEGALLVQDDGGLSMSDYESLSVWRNDRRVYLME